MARDGFDNPVVTAPGQAPEAKWAEREAMDRALDAITGKDGSVVGAGEIRLGQIVHVRGFPKGDHRAHVVLDAGSVPGRIVVAYCATDRWQTPKTYAIEFIVTELQDNAHVRRARRRLEREPYDSDGWKRIGVGPLYNPVAYRVGHKDVP